MNVKLQNNIVEHIFSSFAIFPSTYINLNKSGSLKHPNYLLPEKIVFEEKNKIISNKVWGCQLTVSHQKIKVMLGNCSIDESEDHYREYALLVKPEGLPAYGLYVVWDKYELKTIETVLACSVDDESWMECNTYLQATFLAAMEQTRDLGMSWAPISFDSKEMHKILLSFIEFKLKEDQLNEGEES
jgi:hypothetical protein